MDFPNAHRLAAGGGIESDKGRGWEMHLILNLNKVYARILPQVKFPGLTIFCSIPYVGLSFYATFGPQRERRGFNRRRARRAQRKRVERAEEVLNCTAGLQNSGWAL